MKTKYLILGALLSVVSAIFQCIPALFSEIFIFLTIFSSIPIYFMARKFNIKPNEVYGKYFVSKPARSCVAVKTLPKNVLCDVEVIATVGID